MNTPIKASVVITCHQNADFDALAAMVAARKLYPRAALIFPGSQEKNIKNFFIQSAFYLYNFKMAREVDLEGVSTLVVVDTRQKSRLSHVFPLLDRKDVEIHIFDHHPQTEEDIQGDLEDISDWGATTSMLVLKIREQGLAVTEDEATIFGLGIYEDTGCFTFNSTTAKDLEAGAWLHTQGMDLNIISDMVSRDLSADQITVLNELIENSTRLSINGVEIVVAEASMETYFGDFALLAHKLMEIENIRVLFAIARMHDRVHMVARSRSAEVDVGKICSSLGGGGHSYAASASIKKRTPAEVKNELFALLYSEINPQVLVKDIMSTPPVYIRDSQNLAKAAEIMTRYGLKAVPVLNSQSSVVEGILDHQLADKAVGHGLGHIAVREYMHSDCHLLGPDSDLYQVMEIIIGQHQRLIPVVENQALTGVVTRTDLVNILVREPARLPESLLPQKKRERNIKSMLKDRLPEEVFNMLVSAGELAEEMGYSLYCVGGFVRDILLARNNLDVDLVVEGDGIVFARELARKLGGRIRAHKKFRTAVVILPDDQRIDVATARLEYYEYPAALPTVELSSIKMDLNRRDFTINSLAVHLNSRSFGKLVDFFGGQRDIKEKTIRVLHSLSFVEDPTRIIRAIRFEQRFQFKIGKQTEKLIKNAVELDTFHRLSGNRIFQELRLIFEEEAPSACLRRMNEFGLLKIVNPYLELTPTLERMLEEIDKVLNWYRLLYMEETPRPWIVFFAGLFSSMNDRQLGITVSRLNLSKKQAECLYSLRQQVREAVQQIYFWYKNQGRLSELYFILDPLSLEALLYLMARSQQEDIRRHISTFVTTLRDVELYVSGRDVVAAGVPPGPEVGRILRELTAAQIDGECPDRESQLKWLEKKALTADKNKT
ncbi:MAG: CBS domain-containing protein [Desulfonatronovibrionaceae bacterium]